MRILISLIATFAACLCSVAQTAGSIVMPNREFRGAWMHTVFQPQYKSQTTEQCKEYIRRQLALLSLAGVNTVYFQVRPSADAFYQSNLEPWSRFLTDGGNPPSPYWDPLEFIIEEAHKRGMELHAWLNPYRVTTSKNEKLPTNHLYHREPWRFVTYDGDGKMYFDPGLPENRKFIEDVIMDIISRYDVDGIHFDDYFYPYPAGGKQFPDNASYARYGNGMDRGDWRRQNIDLLIEGIHNRIAASEKPWVRFGVSPFGIWRNKKSDPKGSDTNGLQNYDDLFADVLLWAKNGWIDYLLPQIYWELDNSAASYIKLVDWWANIIPEGCQLYIGQDVERTMKHSDAPYSADATQLRHKLDLAKRPTVQGNCWWPAYYVTSNMGGVLDSLMVVADTSAVTIPPRFDRPGLPAPGAPRNVKVSDDGVLISWDAPASSSPASSPKAYIVFAQPTEEAPYFPISCTLATTYYNEELFGCNLMVMALDRLNRLSAPAYPDEY